MKIIAATSNKGKIREIKAIFSEFEIISMKDFGIDIDIEENGKTFEENALIKARTVSELTEYPVLADDSGLCVKALNGKPGIYSARYCGDGASDEDKCRKLLAEMRDAEDREAKFVSCVALVYPDRTEITAIGEVKGKIGYEMTGENGFGYDPIFIPDGMSKTFAQATEEEKNNISHRKRALTGLYEKIKNS